jgi:hypothetical protein
MSPTNAAVQSALVDRVTSLTLMVDVYNGNLSVVIFNFVQPR